MKQIYYLAIACLLLLSSAVLPAWAQQRLVQGTVQDEKGETLPGVAIRVAGTTVAVTTDPNGVFKINVPPNRNTLVFSYMGMKIKEVILNGQSQLTVTLQAASNSLDEVVVVGYGTVKRRDLTGAVASVKGESLLKTVPISVNQALQGQLAGVDVQRNDGAPGSGISIQIRGANSFASSTEPLYVIDGIPFTTAGTPANVANNQNMAQTINPLATLNPADIESVEVLKDASSTAIYGSRGANGVVLITTKKGKAGQDKIEFSANSSFNQISKKLKILNAYQYAQFQNEAVTNQNNYEGTNKGLPYSGLPYVDPLTGNTYISPKPEDFLTGTKGAKTADGFKGTDWQNEIFQNSFTQDYTLRLSGGNDKGTYAVSGNYVDQPGIIVNSGFKRYGTQINIARKVHDWIEIGTNNNISRNIYRLAKTNSDASNVINSALHFPTTMPVFDESTASGTSQVDWFSANPYLYVRQAKDITNSTGIYSSSYLKLNFSKNLNFQQNLGYNYSQNTRNVYYNRYLSEGKDPVNGVASKADDSWQGVTLESILNYNKTFAGKHNLAATGVFSYETGQYISKSMYAKNFPNDILEDNDIGSALDQPIVRSNKGENALLSFMGRVNYNFSNKYFLTATFRRDGSSKFATQNKWGNFPSLAAAYTVSEESFLKNNPVISNLKVRGSWGQTGNQSIGAYATADRLTTANAVINGSRVSGFSNVGPTDPDLKWETTTASDAGLDIGFLKDRLSLTVDVYYKKTSNLLQNLLIPPSTGFNNITTNYGNVTNKGLEISVVANPVKTEKFSWNLNANISFNRNKISGLRGDQFGHRLWSGIDQVFLQRNGMPIGAILGYVEDGFYDNEAEVRADPAYANKGDAVIRSMIGEIKYKNLDNDPSSIGASDRTIIGNTNPNYSYGITNNLNYKNLSLSFFIQGVQGKQLINSNLLNVTMGEMGNITQAAWDGRWTPDNYANATWQKPNSSYNRRRYFSNKIIEDGSYLRLKNVNLGYVFRTPFKGIETINLFANVSNVFTVTKYSWYDPDVNSFANDPSSRGVDMNAYPNTRTYTIGLKTVF